MKGACQSGHLFRVVQVQFTSGGVLQEKPAPKPAPAPVAVAAAAAAAAAAAKKSKWDKAGPSKQPVALPSQSALGTGIGSAKK